MPRRIKKGDMVAVISGDERGKRGRVLEILVAKDRVVVEGVNLVFKHLRKSQQHPNGGRIRKEAAIHISNVMPIDPESNDPTRVSVGEQGGQRIRVGRRSKSSLEVEVSRRAKRGAKEKGDAKKAAATSEGGEG